MYLPKHVYALLQQINRLSEKDRNDLLRELHVRPAGNEKRAARETGARPRQDGDKRPSYPSYKEVRMGLSPLDRRRYDRALLNAASLGDTQEVISLLDCGANVRAGGEYAETALHLAVNQGHYQTAKVLLERGADPNAESPEFGTPLAIAFLSGSKKMFRLLVEHGAATNHIPQDSKTSLFPRP